MFLLFSQRLLQISDVLLVRSSLLLCLVLALTDLFLKLLYFSIVGCDVLQLTVELVLKIVLFLGHQLVICIVFEQEESFLDASFLKKQHLVDHSAFDFEFGLLLKLFVDFECLFALLVQ